MTGGRGEKVRSCGRVGKDRGRNCRRLGRALLLVSGGMLAVSLLRADPPVAGTPTSQLPAAPNTIAQTVNPLDEPLRLVLEAAQAYQQVRDYTCILIKQERIQGRLQENNIIQMKFRQQPFSVYLRWLAPQTFAGQEVCYVQGRNNNMMRVRSAGVLGKFGFVSIPVNDPRAREHSRHLITEAGLGNLINQTYRDWTHARQTGQAMVRLADYKYDNRLCTRVEVIQTTRDPQAYCYRGVVYFEKQTHLPIRMEAYDWPRPGGPPEGELLESFSYASLQLNVGLTDAAFNY
jgi:hypothetical protein